MSTDRRQPTPRPTNRPRYSKPGRRHADLSLAPSGPPPTDDELLGLAARLPAIGDRPGDRPPGAPRPLSRGARLRCPPEPPPND